MLIICIANYGLDQVRFFFSGCSKLNFSQSLTYLGVLIGDMK